MIKDWKRYFFVKDHRGSILKVVDVETGTVHQELKYSEFGDVLQDTNPGFQPFGFAGGLYDWETKLVRFGARDYDGKIGRWLSKDPIRFDGGTPNLYEYAMNDPVNWVDPEGTAFVALIPLLPYITPAIITGAKIAASGLAAWYTGQALGNAYNKSRNSNKPSSQNSEPPLGQNPRMRGPTPTEIILGLAAAEVLDRCMSGD